MNQVLFDTLIRAINYFVYRIVPGILILDRHSPIVKCMANASITRKSWHFICQRHIKPTNGRFLSESLCPHQSDSILTPPTAGRRKLPAERPNENYGEQVLWSVTGHINPLTVLCGAPLPVSASPIIINLTCCMAVATSVSAVCHPFPIPANFYLSHNFYIHDFITVQLRTQSGHNLAHLAVTRTYN